MSRKVVLVYPRHTTGWEAQPWVDMPLGLLCVATPAVRAGYDVKIIDQRVEPDWNTILRRELRQDPLCVGISSSTGPQLRYALEVSEIVREYGKTPVVWGGVHPSLLPEQTLSDRRIDIVVEGEGEGTFLELLQALEGTRPLNSVKGIWFKDDGAATHAGIRPFVDLNQLPPLAYHLIDPRKYIRTVFGAERLSFFTNRGCPYQCAFCFNTVFNRREWRSMEPDLVVRRIKDFVQRYRIRGLAFIDSNFFADADRGRSILRGIIREDLDIVISRINVRADTLLKMNGEDLGLLERAGCKCLCVGVESGSERIRTMLRKPIDLPGLLEMNRNMKRFSMAALYFFMMGFPTETKEELAETFSLIFRLLEDNPQAIKSLNIYTPYPGTELFEIAVAHGLNVPQSIEEWIPFNYRNATRNAPWLSEEMRRIIETVDFCSFFIGKRNFLQPFKKTHPLAVLFCNLYAPLARKRVENFFYRFPLEIKLAKFFRLFAKQK